MFTIKYENESFVQDLGVDVDPERFYVMSDSGAMWGGAENNFASEAEALHWVDEYNQVAADNSDFLIDLDDVDVIEKGSIILAAYMGESDN